MLPSSTIHRWMRHAVPAATMLLIAGCTDRATSPAPDAPENRREVHAQHGTALFIARSLARALTDESARLAVRDAMRASPFAEHKLILQDFVLSPDGASLLDAAAAAGVNRAALEDSIAALGPLDFYAPFDEHRLSWKGTPDVLVGATLDVDDLKLDAFSISGEAVLLDARDGLPERALFIIHPAESKIRRANAPGLPRGETIQDTREDARQALTVPSRPAFDVAPEAPPMDTTFIGQFAVYFNDGWGDNEVEFRSTYYANGSPCCSYTYRFEDADPNVVYTVHRPVSFRVPGRVWGANDHININLWEDDGWEAADFYGFVEVRQPGYYAFMYPAGYPHGEASIYFSDPANQSQLTTVKVLPGRVSLLYDGTSTTLTAYAYDQVGNHMNWKSFTWSTSNAAVATVQQIDYRTARVTRVGSGSATIRATTDGMSGSASVTAPAPGLNVSVGGSTKARPGQTCSHWANVSGGSGNYTYSWSNGGKSQYTSYTISPGQTQYTISVTVVDQSSNAQGQASLTVSVSSSNLPCIE